MPTIAEQFETEREFQALINAAELQATTAWESGFVDQLTHRFKRYGMRMFLSDSQLKHLREIAEKYSVDPTSNRRTHVR